MFRRLTFPGTLALLIFSSLLASLTAAVLYAVEPVRTRIENVHGHPICVGRDCIGVKPRVSDYTLHPTAPTFVVENGSVYQPGVNHRRIVRAELIQVAQINPAYSSAYSPDGYDSATQAELLVQLRALSQQVAQLAALRQVPVQPAAPTPVAPRTAPVGTAPTPVLPGARVPNGGAVGLAVLNSKCAACHQAGKLSASQRFTLLDAKGELVQLTPVQKLAVVGKIYRGEMPPPSNEFGIPPVTDAEFAGVMGLVH